MRHALVHLASIAWLAHALFGSSFHHTHPGASPCSTADEDCRHACAEHARPKVVFLAPHGHHHHRHLAIAASRPDVTAKAPPTAEPPEHSCPGHHHGDDGSCGFVSSHTPQTTASTALQGYVAAAETLFAASAATLPRDELFSPHRGPPLRAHLLLHVLLI